MGYWHTAWSFAYKNSQKFAVWKVIPTVVGAAVSLLLHLQPIQQILSTVAIAAGCYAVLYALEFLWCLLIKAPVALDDERGKQVSALNEQIQALSKNPFDQAQERLVRQKVSEVTEPMREALLYILHHPDVEARQIPVPDGGIFAREWHNRGLLDIHEHRPGNGLVVMATYYTVKPNVRSLLENIFYPRISDSSQT